MLEVAKRFIAIDEQEKALIRSGYLDRSHWTGTDFRGRAESRNKGGGDVLWHRFELSRKQQDPSRWDSRFVTRMEFSPMPDWTFLVEELDIGAGSMIRYNHVNGRWQPKPCPPRYWYVRHDRLPVEVQGGARWADGPHVVVSGKAGDVVYTRHEADLKLGSFGYASVVQRQEQRPVIPEMPKVVLLDTALATADGRTAYLQAAREWSDQYLAACETWARSFESFPERLLLDGGAYVYGDLRIPTELFDFKFLMTLLIGKLDALLKRVPPQNKFVTPATR